MGIYHEDYNDDCERCQLEQSLVFALFELDQLHLDRHLTEQPKLMHQYASSLAEARYEYGLCERKRDVVLAEVDFKIRRNPEKFGLEKVTEKAVENLVTLDPRVDRAERKVLLAKRKVDGLQAMVSALEHRKKTLEGLTYLFGMDYYAEPRLPKNVKERREKVKNDKVFGRSRRRQQ